MSARDDLVAGLVEHACCFSEEDAERRVDAHRGEVALEIGRNALRDGLVPTLTRLVGEANATKLLADYRDAVAHELAEQQRAWARDPLTDAGAPEYGSVENVLEAADRIDPLRDKP